MIGAIGIAVGAASALGTGLWWVYRIGCEHGRMERQIDGWKAAQKVERHVAEVDQQADSMAVATKHVLDAQANALIRQQDPDPAEVKALIEGSSGTTDLPEVPK